MSNRCPKCLLIVDWSLPEYKDTIPKQVQHLASCPWRGRIKQELIRSILLRTSGRRPDEEESEEEKGEDGDKERETQV